MNDLYNFQILKIIIITIIKISLQLIIIIITLIIEDSKADLRVVA